MYYSRCLKFRMLFCQLAVKQYIISFIVFTKEHELFLAKFIVFDEAHIHIVLLLRLRFVFSYAGNESSQMA